MLVVCRVLCLWNWTYISFLILLSSQANWLAPLEANPQSVTGPSTVLSPAPSISLLSFSFFNFQFFPICSGLLPKHQTACPSPTQQILLSVFFDRCSQRCKSMQKRIEPTVHFYQKVQKLYCLWANNWNEGLGWKSRVTIYDLYISHYMTTLMQNSWQQNLCFSHPYTFINKH